jgi:integrase
MNGMPLRAIEGRHVQAFVTFLMNEEELHPGSINDGHLPALRSIFAFALSAGHALSNPCVNVKLPIISKKVVAERAQPREAFSLGFINKLFSSAWYGLGEKGILNSPVYAELATRYWVPLILLAHGFRPIETCQLTLADVFYSGELLCFRVTDEQEGQTVKNVSSKREVPVHTKLLELGFADFVAQRQKQGRPSDRLFPVLEGWPDPAKWFTQQFNRYTRDFLDAPKEYTLHSFRHFWENSRRGAQFAFGKDNWPKGMHFQISGREDIEREEGSAKEYGNFTTEQMEPYLRLIWNDGIELPMKYTEFKASAFISQAARRALVVFSRT